MNHCTKNLSPSQISDMLTKLDFDEEGRFNYRDYVDTVMNRH